MTRTHPILAEPILAELYTFRAGLFRPVSRLGLILAVVIAVYSALYSVTSVITASAQTPPNRVGLLTTGDSIVELRRAKTESWVAVRQESIIAAGDAIRTDAAGRALITLFNSVLTVELSADSTLVIDTLRGVDATPEVALTVERGFVRIRTARALQNSDQFRVTMNQLRVGLQAGEAFLRNDGRAGVYLKTGSASASYEVVGGTQSEALLFSAGSGVRADSTGVSEVVPALDFPRLDSAIDGCPGEFALNIDAQLNVRLGATTSFPRLGGVDPGVTLRFMGVIPGSDWYRIRYRGGFGWINISRPTIRECAGLRVFAGGFGPENTALYSDLTEQFDLTTAASITSTAAATSGVMLTPTATP